MIALLSSMSFESDLILSLLKKDRIVEAAGKKVYKGMISGLDVLLINTGIGKVNASHSVTAVVESFPVDKVINIGVGGAYPEAGLDPGNVAVASKEIFGDDGVLTSSGWKDMKEIGIPVLQKGRKKYFNEFPVSTPSQAFFKAQGNTFTKIKSGLFVTVGSATGTQKRANELEKKFGGICENMEGAAIAQVCAIYGVPMFEVRGISNIVGIRDKRRWRLKEASGNCQKVVLNLLESV
jgi:futalosine hydrolase